MGLGVEEDVVDHDDRFRTGHHYLHTSIMRWLKRPSRRERAETKLMRDLAKGLLRHYDTELPDGYVIVSITHDMDFSSHHERVSIELVRSKEAMHKTYALDRPQEIEDSDAPVVP